MKGPLGMIGGLTVGLIVILMLSMGMFADEIRVMSRLLVGGWDGIRNTSTEMEAIYCDADGCD